MSVPSHLVVALGVYSPGALFLCYPWVTCPRSLRDFLDDEFFDGLEDGRQGISNAAAQADKRDHPSLAEVENVAGAYP